LSGFAKASFVSVYVFKGSTPVKFATLVFFEKFNGVKVYGFPIKTGFKVSQPYGLSPLSMDFGVMRKSGH